ncbi:MAG: chromate transporter [Anaerolineae bacterium]|nr:MAG: chromate transporter [Anaerolineae bacterium]
MTGVLRPVRVPARSALREAFAVARLFLRVGTMAFGGPAASIALIRDEVVVRRRWLTDEQFLDMVGAANLTPGPTASKVAMYVGQARAGLLGLVLAGLGFMAPAVLAMTILAWAYTRYQTTPTAGWLLYGIKPVIIPLIALALWGLGRKAIRSRFTAAVSVGVFALTFVGLSPLALLVGGGLLMWTVQNGAQARGWMRRHELLPLPLAGAGLLATSGALSFSPAALFLVFLKTGAILYGSGYVLFAFLHDDLVTRYQWLTEQQLADAIAMGQLMPGPLSSSAAFIGYLLHGVPGALLAITGIYLPAFLIVAASGGLIARLRQSAWASSLLDGVNVAALGLIAGVLWKLSRTAFPDLYTVLIAGVAALLLWRFKISAAALVVLGAALGLLGSLL